MKFFRLPLIIAAAAASLIIAASAADCGVGVVNVSALRMRDKPAASADVVDVAYSGESVLLLEQSGDWYKVLYNDETGYMYGEYLTVYIKADIDLGSGSVNCSSVNLRTGPGTDYDIVTSMQSGSQVNISGINDGWYKVTSGTSSGYILSDYITLDINTTSDAASSQSQSLIEYAEQYIGTPYCYGGSSSSGFDCSGFTKYVFSNFGYSLNRTAAGQMSNGTSVSQSNLQVGDLVFFKDTSEAASHVGIYIGNNKFIHSASGGVKITSLDSSWYCSRYAGARRVLD